ncbi:hypothetical protein Syun_021924 [Stephania yunnanensis]|uniref:EF-hand domain-containing protein n=1 Tax=Stephania yunnanensis TaxID=152371 RepID=A0AAP0IIG4_9MAGN
MGIRSFFQRRKKQKRPKSNNNNNSEDSPSHEMMSSTNASSLHSSLTSSPMQTRTQVEELGYVFRRFDANGDGKISWTELGSIMASLGYNATEEELHKMIREADSDGDGFIDLNEFIELNTKGVDAVKAIEDLKSAFMVFDVDRNGSISPEELMKVMKSLGERSSIEDCRRMIRGVDSDGDGQINFEEFKVMMMGNGNLNSVAMVQDFMKD